MTLFEELLDRAVRAKRQVHVTIRYAYMNVILIKQGCTYHAHMHSPEQNSGLHFSLKDVEQVTVQQGTDGEPCFDIKLNYI